MLHALQCVAMVKYLCVCAGNQCHKPLHRVPKKKLLLMSCFWQFATMRGSVLQRFAVCCSVLHCSVLLCVAVCCIVLTCVCVHRESVPQNATDGAKTEATVVALFLGSMLQYVAVCYSALQCIAVCCSVLQCVAVCFGVLKYFPVLRT